MDMQATTPVDPRVLDAMLPHYTQQFGNPHSRTHFYGWENEDAVESARDVRTERIELSAVGDVEMSVFALWTCVPFQCLLHPSCFPE